MTKREEFPLISGHPSIDLVNTEVVRRGVRHDLLVTESDLDHWLVSMKETGSLVAVQTTGHPPESLHAVKELRSFLRDGFEKLADKREHAQVEKWKQHLEDLTQRAPLSYKIMPQGLVPIPVGNSTDALLSLIAFDALQLLATKELRTMHRCANPDCVLLFMDSSGRRKWCSMKICGNRAKVARHEEKRAKRPSVGGL
ncbi:CGNR zinc finger domain-containing protein [Alicyclobacillus sp. SO9]|uniref:CGNR zinc finger domain-containing protein n=1 Tax=Alicyclobacillus sp. SO9 TaxID=2665646 RepID=UPI0018E70D81|nr:CGNR zinc finger domain-containing protein [Alicyclobacillus sp. SO9]QQE79139.1 CGNR zinc finger domain-containing protein [Alicyclobacillus sp. SO9]